MATQTEAINTVEINEEKFQNGQVMTIVGGHFAHDTFTAFVAPLLPLIIEKLSISLSAAGLLWGFVQIPALLSPFIGHMADEVYHFSFLKAMTPEDKR